MYIVKAFDKRTGNTYVYESISYWDKEKGQPRSRRKLIGRLDPETNEIVPTRKKKAAIPQNDSDENGLDFKALYDSLVLENKGINDKLVQQSKQIAELSLQVQTYDASIQQIIRVLQAITPLSK